MSRRFCSFAKKWHMSAWFRNLVFAVGVGITALTGCSGQAGTDGADGGSVAGVEDTSARPLTGTGDGEQSSGSVAESNGAREDAGIGATARNEPHGAGPTDAPHFPPASDGGATANERAFESNVPRLPPGVALQRPTVVLSAGHAALCSVRVGDAMPTLTLVDVSAQDQTLPDLFGEKLTVVVFWTLEHPYAAEQFERLHAEVVGPYAEFGVNTVAINAGDPPELVQAAGQQTGAAFPVLLDVDGLSFGQVATGKLPRTYLLDPAGRILWFDIEYSESTRRELNNAILWHLIKEPIVATR